MGQAAGDTPLPRRLFTPIRTFVVGGTLRPLVLHGGLTLVDENDPIYKQYPERFREPTVRAYK